MKQHIQVIWHKENWRFQTEFKTTIWRRHFSFLFMEWLPLNVTDAILVYRMGTPGDCVPRLHKTIKWLTCQSPFMLFDYKSFTKYVLFSSTLFSRKMNYRKTCYHLLHRFLVLFRLPFGIKPWYFLFRGLRRNN